MAHTRYAHRLPALQQAGLKGFIPFALLGWPNLDVCKTLLRLLVECQPAALELGLPFSDPIADGPIIQAAVTEALANGATVDGALELIRYVRSLDAALPIGLLVYYNLLLARGVDRFMADMAQAGVDGILIPDLPPELAQEVMPAAERHNVDLIFIISPLTSEERLATVLRYAGGFLYVVSRLGITGTEARYDTALAEVMQRVRQRSSLPQYVGFGVSEPEQARHMVAQGADGYITASRIIQLVNEQGWEKALTDVLPAYLARMKTVGVPEALR